MYLLAFDQGTTSSRSIIFNAQGETVAAAQREFTQIFPANGWVEHDAEEIWRTQIETAAECLKISGLSVDNIAAAGITNQRETVVCWSKKTGRPLANAIVWQDRRTADFCSQLRETHGNLIRQKTGLECDAYFSASKIRCLLRENQAVQTALHQDDLLCGTMDSWLIWKLTNGKTHVTDVSNASRTMIFNIETLEWDAELLELFGIPREILPEIVDSSQIVAEIETVEELRGVKIAGIAGDQQAALFGQGCFSLGATKNTYGTGCFMLQNIGEKPLASANRLLTTVAWRIGGKTVYALEGSVFIGGAVVQWLRDGLQIIEKSVDVIDLAKSVSDNGGVFFVPALTGLGAPFWNQEARGLICGITRGTTKAHIARAAVESIALQTADLLSAMNADAQITIKELRVDGGATVNDDLLQFQADILQTPVQRAKITETTAFGAALLAGLAVKMFDSTDEIKQILPPSRIFTPKISASEAEKIKREWHKAVQRTLL